MICEIVSVHDSLSGFGSPMLEPNVETAKRNFVDAINSSYTMGRHLHDFALYRLASFDTEYGIINAFDHPILIVSAFDALGGDKHDVPQD